ncbi:hypothetical protein LguiB_010306 [Lonicera macranthoides]
MDNEKDAFYVVRKGDIVGVYKSLIDCQAQLGSSVYDSSVTVYKGYGLPKEAEEYLLSRGLKNAICSIGAADVQADLFGQLVPCPFQHPAAGKKKALGMKSPEKRLQDVTSVLCLSVIEQDIVGSTSFPAIPQRNQVKLDNFIEVSPVSSYCNMAELCKVAKELKEKFISFQISHIDRELNSEADAQANLAVYLTNGEVQVECDKK